MTAKKPKSRLKNTKKNIKLLEQAQIGLDLRKQGLTYQQVAQQTGFWRDRRGAYKAINNLLTTMREELAETIQEVRELELQRLDLYLEKLQNGIGKGDRRCVDSALRVMDRRAKLMGLDAPAKSELEIKSDMTQEQIIAGAIEQLRALGYTVTEP